MEKQNVIISQDLEQSLTQALERQSFDRLFVLTDTTTHRLCRPLLSGMKCLDGAVDIVVKPTRTSNRSCLYGQRCSKEEPHDTASWSIWAAAW